MLVELLSTPLLWLAACVAAVAGAARLAQRVELFGEDEA